MTSRPPAECYQLDNELIEIASRLPSLDLSDVVGTRSQRAARVGDASFELPEGVRLEFHQIPRADGSILELAVYSPSDIDSPRAALYWIHGGGFVLGSVRDDLSSPSEIVRRLGVVIVSPEYRLAPEHPYPAALEDCAAGLRWMAAHASDLTIDPDRFALGGISAGACLATATVLMMRDQGGPAIRLLLLDSPVLDDRLMTHSMRAYVNTPGWKRADAVESWKAYLGTHLSGSVPPYAAPARARGLRGMPATYLAVNGCDPLRDEGLEFALRLMRAGVPTELVCYAGAFHGTMSLAKETSIARRMFENRVGALERALVAS